MTRKRGNAVCDHGAWATFRREMEAFDQLPEEFKQFVRTANLQWACVPMLKRAVRCGRNAYGNQKRLLGKYLSADRTETPNCAIMPSSQGV